MGSNMPIGFYENLIPIAAVLKHTDFLIVNGVLLYLLSCILVTLSNLHNYDYNRKWTFNGTIEEEGAASSGTWSAKL